MPELPDITVYLERLAPRVLGQPLQNTRVLSPFLVRTAQPPLSALHGRPVRELRRIGKRIVYAKNETNYCPRCQNQDRLLADRSLSRLLKDDWPKTLTELEERQAAVPRSGRRARKA